MPSKVDFVILACQSIKRSTLSSAPMKNPNGSGFIAIWKPSRHRILASHQMLNFQSSTVKKALPVSKSIEKPIAAAPAELTLAQLLGREFGQTWCRKSQLRPSPAIYQRTFATQATAWADEAGVKLTLTLGNPTTIEVVGKGAHAQEPKDGKNAGTYLANLLADLPFDPAGKAYLLMVAKYLHNDSRGKLLGINYTDKLMGELTASPDVVSLCSRWRTKCACECPLSARDRC